MTLTWPFWLVLAIPMALALWLRPLPTRGLTAARAVMLALLLLAISGLAVWLPSRVGVVVLVADRSSSMPAGSQNMEKEIADRVYKQMTEMAAGNQFGVVSFGERAIVERVPQTTPFTGFDSDVGGEASNLTDGVELALSLIPRGSPGRVLVVSDGYATGRDVSEAAVRAAGAEVAVDYYSMQRPTAGDLAIERVDAPSSVAAGEAFMLTAWIVSPKPQQVTYELVRGERVLASGTRAVATGRNRIMFRDKVGDAGTNEYTLRVQSVVGAKDDPVPENNLARFLIGVRGLKPLLCVGPPESALPRLLAAGGLKVERRQPADCRWSLAALAGYSGVVIEDTPASEIGVPAMETLAAWVTQAGGGLLTTGGRNAYAVGGYYKSPLEPIMPVSMEMHREHRKFSLAIVVTLDRSGSMAMTVPGGKRKIDLADLATVEVLKQLSPLDEFGCEAVDTVAHEIVPLSPVANTGRMAERILRIDSEGGGIYVDVAIDQALAMMSHATAGTRHIVLFADANDAEQSTGNYRELLEKCKKAGVTVSAIGLGSERDKDANLLKEIAKLGGGQCMFAEDPHDLPRVFAQDTFVVARSAILTDPTPVRATAGMSLLTPQSFGEMPKVGGYNLSYLRPTANLAAVTLDEYAAPLVAAWQAGTGRVICYTGQADGELTGPIGHWSRAGDFFTSLARWVAAQDEGLGPDMLLTEELRGGICHFQLHMDSDRRDTPFSTPPELSILRGRETLQPASEHLPLAWSSADALSADLPLAGGETLLATLDLPGIGRTTLPPVCLPYSAEFAPRASGEGERTLERLARATGGQERHAPADIWSDLPRRPRLISMAPWLLLGAMTLLLVEVFQRRTGLLSFNVRFPTLRLRRRKQTLAAKSAAAAPRSGRKPSPAAPLTPLTPAEPEETPAIAAEAPPPEPDGVAGALAKARKRSQRRTGR